MRRSFVIVAVWLLAVSLLLMAGLHVEAPTRSFGVTQSATKATRGFLAGRDRVTLLSGGKAIHVELATTDTERIQGLGNREAIASDEGMLFVFPMSDVHGIWMKGMRFPLDILWLEKKDATSQELVVMAMEEGVAPETFPRVFSPEVKTSLVLELKGGGATQHGIRIGSILTLKE